MSYKQPRSVQVVLFTETPQGREYLAACAASKVTAASGNRLPARLKRVKPTLEAAIREVYEETGYRPQAKTT
jgi:8-oxo-dGTP pyrophosphatase MutT (NUDIX family)